MEAGVLVPILVPISMFAMIFGIVYLHKRERMAMIERGMDPRSYKSQPAPFRYLKWALLLIGSGLGLFLATVLTQFVFSHWNSEDPSIHFSMIGICGGLGLFMSYLIEKKETFDNKE